MRGPVIPEYRSLTPDALDALERAVRERRRVALRRRGTEDGVVAERLGRGAGAAARRGGRPPARGRAGRRVALRRRGPEYVVVAERLEMAARDEALQGRLPMTGELLAFPLHE